MCALIVVTIPLIMVGDHRSHVFAQSSDQWSTPINLSFSGSASRPAVALASDGVAHALWWDTLDGSRYLRGTITDTQMQWRGLQPVPFLVGERERDPSTNRVTIGPPSQLRVLADGSGNVHATWLDADRQLRYAVLPPNGRWSERPRLSDKALASSMSVDISGTLRLAFVQSSQAPRSPAGVYYAQRVGGNLRPTLVYSSTYFRTADPRAVSVGVAADGKGNVIVAWRQSPEDQSQFARSTDNGATWSNPELVASVSELFGIATQVSVAAAKGGEFILLWRDLTAPGCGLTQRRSTDGGVTWSSPERVLTELARCPAYWSFSQDTGGKLWLIGLPASASPLSDTDGALAAWNGDSWSKPVDVQITYRDASTQRTRVLGCLNVALSGKNLVVIGCDARGDVWSAHNQVALEQLLPTEELLWNSPIPLSRSDISPSTIDSTKTTRHITVAADEQGRTYMLWSRAASASLPARTLDISVYDGRQLSGPRSIFKAAPTESANADAVPSKMDAPSLAIDARQHLHLVWSGGQNGRPFYSNAFAREASESGRWSRPVALPSPRADGAAPQIVADLRGDVLYVIYAVPVNEQRGIYLLRTDDGGESWSEPMLVADGAEQNWPAVDQPQLGLDAEGNVLHATWLQSTLPGTTGPRAIFYARSADGGRTWSSPLRVAQGAVDAPRIAVLARDTVAVAWNLARDATGATLAQDVWYQLSDDGGMRWTSADRVPGIEQVTGGSAFVSDRQGQLYLAALSEGAGGQTRLLFTQWQGRTWSQVDELNLGRPAVLGNAAAGTLDRRNGLLHLLLKVFELKPSGAGTFESVAISRAAMVSELVPLPTFTPLPPPTQTPLPVTTATPTPQPEAISTTPPSSTSGSGVVSGNMLLVSAGIATAVVIVGALLGTAIRRRR